MYGPIWVYLWKNTFLREFPMLKPQSRTKEIAGKPLLTPEILAFFDCCVATAHHAQNVAEAEKRTPITTLCPLFVAEHARDESREVREKVLKENDLL
jgi:hypothetical protein